MNFYFIIYFLTGVLVDLIFVLNVRFIALRNLWLAVITSFLSVIIGMLVFYNIISSLDPKRSILAIIVYGAGIGVGTYLAMKFKLESKE